MKLMFAPFLGCSRQLIWLAGKLLSQFASGGKASIFVRKTLPVRLRDRKMRSILQARREGPAFFDEDDVCDGF